MTNFVSALTFSLLSTGDFEDRTTATEIARALVSLPPDIRPRKFGTFKPLKTKIENVDRVVDTLVNLTGPKSSGRGGSLLLGRANELGFSIQWNKSPRSSFSLISGWIEFDFLDRNANALDGWLTGIKQMVEIVAPAYGYISSMTVENWDTPINLQLRLPDIAPISVYGREYIKLFGERNIEGAPFRVIEKVGECYWLVAQDSLKEAVPAKRRREIRAYFGEDAFMADGCWKYIGGRAPKFDSSNSGV